MEAARIKQVQSIAGYTVLAWSASASVIYVVTDSKGNRVYTDRPEQLPAKRVTVRTSPADTAAAQKATSTLATAQLAKPHGADRRTTQAGAATAEQLTAEDLAKRCAEAGRRYEAAMTSLRLYEPRPNGVRRYLSSEEIDAERINAKQTMYTFCGGQ